MVQKKIGWLVPFVLFGLFGLFFYANSFALESQSERILNFYSSIVVNKDASIDVTEIVSAQADQKKIIHGLVRWLPTHYTDSYGISRSPDYQLRQILVNNQPALYHTQRTDNQLAIYIGEKDVTLSPGIYVFTIQYHVDYAVNALKDADELYWNITGNNWDFPIVKAEADITLPEGAIIQNFAGYTGKKGEKGSDFFTRSLADNRISFATTRPLMPGDGLTIAVAWPKGIIHHPGIGTQLKNQLYVNRGGWIAIEIGLILLVYYFIVWYMVGRDLRPGTIIPLFEPPENLTPAVLRYIRRMGYDTKALTAALLSMATKGYLTIQNKDDTFVLTKTDEDNLLSPEESVLGRRFFETKSSFQLQSSNASVINQAKKDFKTTLKKTCADQYFITNTSYLLPGLVLTLLAFFAAVGASHDHAAALFAVIWLSIWTFACTMLFLMAWRGIQHAYYMPSFRYIFSASLATLFAIPFFGGEIAGLIMFSRVLPISLLLLLLIIVIANIVFFRLLKAPTPAGRKLMDQIEGFKRFLSTTERYRLEQFTPPEQTPEQFEKYLPYAIALNVENEWGEKFNHLLVQAGRDPQTYRPQWYSGDVWTGTTAATLPVFLNSGLSSALATSSISSSSSASGGGGSSGGGGGGGGGW